jgi:hypothetical protein
VRYPAAEDDQDAVRRAAEHLISLFMLVVVGELTPASRHSSMPSSAPKSCRRVSPPPRR